MSDDDDDDGQYDGDSVGAARRPSLRPSPFVAPGQPGSPFASGFGQQPWLRGAMPPWHLWGSSIELVVNSVGLDPDRAAINGQQIVRVAYGRPETWSFYFAGRLLGDPLPGPAFVALAFDISTGLGRSAFPTVQPIATNQFNTSAFCKFVWNVPAATPLETINKKWTTRVPSPVLDDRDATSSQAVEWIAAQDIQVTARLIVLPILVPTPVTYRVEAHAYFAPRSHVRPDWYLLKGPEEAQFPGAELGAK